MAFMMELAIFTASLFRILLSFLFKKWRLGFFVSVIGYRKKSVRKKKGNLQKDKSWKKQNEECGKKLPKGRHYSLADYYNNNRNQRDYKSTREISHDRLLCVAFGFQRNWIIRCL
jgi:hypothetical protein